MKILFLFPHFLLPGGAANLVLRFAKELQQNGYKIKILCASASHEFLKENSQLKILPLHIPTSNSLLYWMLFPYWQFKINRILKKYKDYIFFPQVFPSNWWAWLYKLSHKSQKIIWYCNEPSAFIHSKIWIMAIPNTIMKRLVVLLNPILKQIDVYLEKYNNAVICNSEFTRKEYEATYKRKSSAVLYPAINISPHLAPAYFKKNYFLTVSHLSKFKNTSELIKAFSNIQKKIPAYSLLIVGEGEDKENLIELRDQLNLSEKINFLGKISNKELGNIYSNARATILCSRKEPFGLVSVESMSYGTPAIVHKSGGPQEIISENKNGFFFSDQKELEEKMVKIADLNDDNYFQMQNNCHRTADNFDIKNIIEKLKSILKKNQ